MIELKIGRHKYAITESDKFMDNGHCVQLMTQSLETPCMGCRSDPVLSKRAVKEISNYDRRQLPHGHSSKVSVFKLIL